MKFDISKGVAVILRDAQDDGARHGKERFFEALAKNNVRPKFIEHYSQAGEEAVIVIGAASDRRVQILLENNGVDYRRSEEAVFYQWCEIAGGRNILLIAGSDTVGLMYALLELAQRMDHHGTQALGELADTAEYPDNAVRCMDRYLLGPLDDEWMNSEEFWHFFLGRLANGRYNRFCLIMGYDTPYMSPPYPYFLSVPGYEQVRVGDLNDDRMSRNLAQLRRIGQLCHEYGQKFFLATWQQKANRLQQQSEVVGMDETVDLGEYCHEGIKALLYACPEIDGVQFRVNHESGVGSQVSAEDFWNHCVDSVAEVARKTGRKLTLDLRAKGLSDSIIAYAFATGLHVEVATKYWCEHAALPYHLAVMRTEELTQLDNLNFSRRYSYADLLQKPKYYDVVFRLWNYGSTNLFLWGDADYARRFSQSCSLGGAIGFQVNNPLALKGGYSPLHKQRWDTFRDPALRSGKWEEERFWMWYTVFGRVGYNIHADAEIWMREFRTAFGAASAPVLEKGLRYASKIIPLITTFHMPMHPSLTYWTEMSTGWALFSEHNPGKKHKQVSYGNSEPSDTGIFYGIDEYAQDLENGSFKGKYSPLQVAAWLGDYIAQTRQAIAEAEAIGENAGNPEYHAMKVDFELLCYLAAFHIEKINAALALARYGLNGQREHLSDAYLYHLRSKEQWEALSQLGLQAYHHDLEFSSGNTKTRHGTWNDLMPEIEADERKLAGMLGTYLHSVQRTNAYHAAALPESVLRISTPIPNTHTAGKDFRVELNVSGHVPGGLTLHYRHTNQLEGVFNTVSMSETATGYVGVVPAEYIAPEWDLLVYVSANIDGSAYIYPGVYHPEYPYPYQIVEITN